MISKYLIIVLWFICSVFIITGCRITGSTPPVKDYVFVSECDLPDFYARGNFLTIDPDGNIYVQNQPSWANHYPSREIDKYNSQGKFITKWSCECRDDAKDFYGELYGVVTDNQNIYVLDNGIDYANQRSYVKSSIIKKYDLNGKFITRWKIGNPVDNITVDKEKNVYLTTVCDDFHLPSDQILKYDSNGKLTSIYTDITKHISRPLKNFHDFFSPFPLPIYNINIDSSEYIYIFANGCIAKYDSSGRYVKQFNDIFGRYLAIDSSDNIYVADEKNNFIRKFDSNGNFITKLGVKDDNKGIYVNYMLVDSQGNVYVLVGSTLKKYAPVLNKTK